MTIRYLDSSAILKLLLPEPESAALREATRGWPAQATSALAGVEVARALRRADRGDRLDAARRLLGGLRILAVDDDVLRRAAALEPDDVCSLDAIHLAAAMTLDDELDAVVTYDRRMAQAAAGLGLGVESPA